MCKLYTNWSIKEITRIADPYCVTQGDFIAAQTMKLSCHISYFVRRYGTFNWASHNT